jgi:hypothetical protein
MVVTLALAALLVGCGADGSTDQPRSQPETTGAASWTELPASPLSARYEPVSVWDGSRFYVIGGYEGAPCPPNADCALSEVDPLRDGAAYDPQTSTWTSIATAPMPVTGQSVVVGTTIYILTYEMGRDGTVAFMSYDIAHDEWRLLPPPEQHEAWLSGTDEVAMVFDDARGRNAYFDPAAMRWRLLPVSPFGAGRGGYPVWTGEQVLLTAHKEVPNDQAPVVELAALDPTSMTWTDLGETDIVGYGPVRVGDLVVWPSPEKLDGGEVDNWGRAYDEGGVYDPANDAWKDLPPLLHSRGGVCCTVTTDHLLSIYGNLLDPHTDTWVEVAAPPGGERYASALVGGGDHVLVWGGTVLEAGSGSSLDTGYLLTIAQ